jgi:hypothetical protein
MRSKRWWSAFTQPGAAAASSVVSAIVRGMTGHLRNGTAGAPVRAAAIFTSTATGLGDAIRLANISSCLTNSQQEIDSPGHCQKMVNQRPKWTRSFRIMVNHAILVNIRMRSNRNCKAVEHDNHHEIYQRHDAASSPASRMRSTSEVRVGKRRQIHARHDLTQSTGSTAPGQAEVSVAASHHAAIAKAIAPTSHGYFVEVGVLLGGCGRVDQTQTRFAENLGAKELTFLNPATWLHLKTMGKERVSYRLTWDAQSCIASAPSVHIGDRGIESR